MVAPGRIEAADREFFEHQRIGYVIETRAKLTLTLIEMEGYVGL